jgi:hypothetical protein
MEDLLEYGSWLFAPKNCGGDPVRKIKNSLRRNT